MVRAFRNEKIAQVSCGDSQTAFLTDRGQLFVSGDNRHGKMGLSQRAYNSISFSPVLVEKFKRLRVENVASGGCHMILIGKLNQNSRDLSDDDSIREKGYSDKRSARVIKSKLSKS